MTSDGISYVRDKTIPVPPPTLSSLSFLVDLVLDLDWSTMVK